MFTVITSGLSLGCPALLAGQGLILFRQTEQLGPDLLIGALRQASIVAGTLATQLEGSIPATGRK
jgi:hypothetical protein